ncbi:hypothetical protein [Marinobacter sp. LV10R510-11A]|uniref:hypothetical protein n=1 Tax=Marinobacter sp. LV10R510-11A TaxID=1415568 RepID=UPI0012FE5AEB|nr:hypothetical protein [Marinobacter sp. LV10R510-11A]
MKATQFRIRYFEKGSEPDMKTLKKLIEEGDLPGQKMGTIYYVDLDRIKVSSNPLVNKVLAA